MRRHSLTAGRGERRLRSIKSVGIAVLISAALVALGAPIAAAEGIEFRSEAEHTLLSGEGSGAQVLKTTGAEVICQKAEFEGTVLEEDRSVKEISLKPTYQECKVKIGGEELSALVEFTGCSYVLSASKETEANHFEGSAQIACENPEEKIHVKATGAKVKCLTIPPQKPAGKFSYVLEGTGGSRDVKASAGLSGMEYTVENELCGTPGTYKTGSQSGEATLKGEDTSENAVGVWIDTAGPPVSEFHSEVEHTALEGEAATAQTFDSAVGEFTCPKAKYEGTVLAASRSAKEISLKPSYEGCKVKLEGEEIGAFIEPTGCSYVLKVTGEAEGGALQEGPARIECEKAEERIHLKLTVLKIQCLTIPPQTLPGVVDYVTEGAGTERKVRFYPTVSGVEYIEGGGCGSETRKDGVYGGEATIKGKNTAGGSVGFSVGPGLQFHSEVEHTSLSGEAVGEQVFKWGSSEARCKKLKYEGTFISSTHAVSEISVKPSYEECTATVPGLGTVKATIDFTSCSYQFGGLEVAAPYRGIVQLRCTVAEDQVHIKITGANLKCLTFSAQALEGSVDYSLEGSGASRDLKQTFTTSLEGTLGGACGTGTTSATYSGEETVKAKNTEGTQVGLWIE
ncbi:MAG TPA: hypothetical protein VHQ43_08860 [Solirubrobacterales bacterium]|jgi:hypothetical protein|nr:hypothetical protein [Solirubrobacterales bacterium]